MTDAEKREKVIRGLECCTKDECECCPYENVCFGDDEVEIFDTLARDALALLKAQDAQLVIVSRDYIEGTVFRCPKCKEAVHKYNGNYCPHCGQAVKWE